MSTNPFDYHVNVVWDQKDLVYKSRCVELPQCSGQHKDPRMAINEAVMEVADLIDHRESLRISLPNLASKKCPCCFEHAFTSGVCSYCDYDKRKPPVPEKKCPCCGEYYLVDGQCGFCDYHVGT